MVVGEVLSFVGQYGLPLVLLVILGYAYDRKEKAHEADRKRWEEALNAERSKCAAERKEWDEERTIHYDRSRVQQDHVQAVMLENQRHMLTVIASTREMAAVFEQEKKEIREAREREIRETGPRLPFKLPQGPAR